MLDYDFDKVDVNEVIDGLITNREWSEEELDVMETALDFGVETLAAEAIADEAGA